MTRTAALLAALTLAALAPDARAQVNPFRQPAAPQYPTPQYPAPRYPAPQDADPLPLPQAQYPRQPFARPQYPQPGYQPPAPIEQRVDRLNQELQRFQIPSPPFAAYPQQPQYPRQPFGGYPQSQYPPQVIAPSPPVIAPPGGHCDKHCVQYQVFARGPRCREWHLVATLPTEDAADALEDQLDDQGYDTKVRRLRP